jgi:NAD(P)-dependent dehydrogenase (short-subunit alcohol dehydrogenase family)
MEEIVEDTEIVDKKHISMHGWYTGRIPPQAGRLAVITGGTSGLGFETALKLAQGCVDVILAGRDEAKGREALGQLRPMAPHALIRFEMLDLARQDSVAAFAERLAKWNRPVDLLINNAGVMALPKRETTADGFEMQLATNYLGHFALTGRLLPLLRQGRRPRVVQVSSLGHRYGSIHFDDLHGERGYGPWAAYCQSKLAALMFALELQRRSVLYGWGLQSNAAHPGYSRRDRVAGAFGAGNLLTWLNRRLGEFVGQSAADGAQSALLAATSPNAQPGEYYGPRGFLELAGQPAQAAVGKRALDRDVAKRLWEVSEQLTGVRWPVD